MGIQIYKDHDHERKLRQIKFELCMLIRSAAMAQGWNQKRMAANLGISQQSAGYVVKGYVERVTFNQIFNYMICMDPQLNILVSMYPKMTAAIGQSRSLRESATSY